MVCIIVQLQAEAQTAYIRIEDDGVGISDEQTEKTDGYASLYDGKRKRTAAPWAGAADCAPDCRCPMGDRRESAMGAAAGFWWKLFWISLYGIVFLMHNFSDDVTSPEPAYRCLPSRTAEPCGDKAPL